MKAQLSTKQEVERRYEIFLRVIVELARRSAEERRQIAQTAGVAFSSYGHWLSGHVTHPRLNTLIKTAHALGYDVELVRRKAAPTLRRVK